MQAQSNNKNAPDSATNLDSIAPIESKPISVSALNAQVKTLLESSFANVFVTGEVSNCTLHSSGHIYFSLKDEQSSIKCVMFKGYAKNLRFSLQNGMSVVVKGEISVYPPRGDYQILCHSINNSGEGELAIKYEELKQKLRDKGYFNNKKPLPLFPKHICVLTSITGAALQDMLRVARKRWNLTKISVIDTLVQGAEAKQSIANNIRLADSFFGSSKAFDIIVIGRGGGSREDLWAFNEEIVAEAIYRARTPIVSAVGHEIDVMISDFVADLRAPTPSACMEMILPDSKEWLLRIDELNQNINELFLHLLTRKIQQFNDLKQLFQTMNYEYKYAQSKTTIAELNTSLHNAMAGLLASKKRLIDRDLLDMAAKICLDKKSLMLESMLKEANALNPANKIKRGYVAISKNNVPAGLENLAQGEIVELCDGKILATAKILSLSTM